MPPPLRDDRQYDSRTDQRSAAQRDRDRVLYTSALRRLAGVTQVVGPAEGHLFHNRLTHTLEVAQIARRLAEKICQDQQDLADHWGTINLDTVEAAALIHDLGHPPFGHTGERELNRLVSAAGVADGYEGNAQSFRIVIRLERRREEVAGLDLTRATLDAALKYPWLRETDSASRGTQKARKWGAYLSEKDALIFARAAHPPGELYPCLEAQIMDWADDIAYSIHDTADFFQAGLIPLDRLFTNSDEVDRVFLATVDRWHRVGHSPPFDMDDLEKVFRELCRVLLPSDRPYAGTRMDRARLRRYTSGQISRYLIGTRLRSQREADGSLLDIHPEFHVEILMLKELTWHYVLENPALAAQRYGHQRVITTLFEIYTDAAHARKWALLPGGFREEAIEQAGGPGGLKTTDMVRLVADMIAAMTDQQALKLYLRLTGFAPGSILDPILA